VQERLKGLAMQVVGNRSPEAAAEYLRNEMATLEPVVRAAGIRAN
jgi:hypothetical protein